MNFKLFKHAIQGLKLILRAPNLHLNTPIGTVERIKNKVSIKNQKVWTLLKYLRIQYVSFNLASIFWPWILQNIKWAWCNTIIVFMNTIIFILKPYWLLCKLFIKISFYCKNNASKYFNIIFCYLIRCCILMNVISMSSISLK